jgi:hypothetical protein
VEAGRSRERKGGEREDGGLVVVINLAATSFIYYRLALWMLVQVEMQFKNYSFLSSLWGPRERRGTGGSEGMCGSLLKNAKILHEIFHPKFFLYNIQIFIYRYRYR